MAVYWVDPYAEADIGGIHGTVDITTRNGTYAYPWLLSDVIGTSTGVKSTINGTTLANGDEIRFKGLSDWTDFAIDLGSTWYGADTQRLYDTNASNTTLTGYLTTHPVTGGTNGIQWPFMFDPDESKKVTVASSTGKHPCIIRSYSRSNDTYWYANYSTYGASGYHGGVFQQLHPSGNDTGKMYLVDPQYFIYDTSVYNRYLGFHSYEVKYTDGWTSETARDGCNVIIYVSNGSYSQYTYMYFNYPSSNYTNCKTLFDMPNTHWMNQTWSSTSSNGRARYYLCSATGGGQFSGNSSIQKFGSFACTNYYSSQIYDYTSNYYYSSYSGTTGCNNSDITLSSGTFAGIYGPSGTQIVKRMRNHFGYYGVQCAAYNYWKNFEIGSVISYYGNSGNGLITGSSNGYYANSAIKLLRDSKYFSIYSSSPLLSAFGSNLHTQAYIDSAGHNNDSDEGHPLIAYNSFTNNGRIIGAPNDSAGLGISSSALTPLGNDYNMTDPSVLGQGGGGPGLVGKVKLAATNWYESDVLKGTYMFNNSEQGAYVMSQSIAVLDTEGQDYTTTDATLKIETDASYRANSTSYLQYPSFHASRNTYDGKPIAFLPATDDANANTACIGYNNDSNGFCVQSNPNDNNDYFGKDFEITLPTYDPSSQNIRIDCTYRFETMNGNGIASSSYMRYYYNNSAGGLSISSATLNYNQSSNTTVQTTITGSNMAQGDDKVNHIVGRLAFLNNVSNTSTPDRGRLVIVSLSAVAV